MHAIITHMETFKSLLWLVSHIIRHFSTIWMFKSACTVQDTKHAVYVHSLVKTIINIKKNFRNYFQNFCLALRKKKNNNNFYFQLTIYTKIAVSNNHNKSKIFKTEYFSFKSSQKSF